MTWLCSSGLAILRSASPLVTCTSDPACFPDLNLKVPLVNWPEQALRNFTWIYKQKGFPWLKDSGSADAEVPPADTLPRVVWAQFK